MLEKGLIRIVFFTGRAGFFALFAGFLSLFSSLLLLAVSAYFLTGAGIAGLLPESMYAFNYLQPAAFIRFLAILRTLAFYMERLVSHDAILRLLAKLRFWLFASFARTDYFFLKELGTGELMQNLLSDIDLLDQWPLRGFAPWFWTFTLTVLFSLFFYFLSFQLFLVFSLSMLLIFLFQLIFFFPLALKFTRSLLKKGGMRRQFLLETLSGFITLSTCGMLFFRFNDFKRQDKKVLKIEWNLQCMAIFSSFFIQFTLSVSIALILFKACVLVEKTSFSPALLAGLICALLAFIEITGSLSQTFFAYAYSKEARSRLLSIKMLSYEKERKTVEDKELSLLLSDLFFKYKDFLFELKDISLELKKGDRLWIAGPSGCGKSTLAALMAACIKPSSGSIFLNAMPVDEIREDILHRYIGFLEQDCRVFPLSIRENLKIAKSDADDKLLYQVLEDVRLKNWLEKLPEGLDSSLALGGISLSGGEIKRLALARLLLMETPILILDELFEGLDRENIELISDMLCKRQKDGILIIVSHQEPGIDFTHKYVFK